MKSARKCIKDDGDRIYTQELEANRVNLKKQNEMLDHLRQELQALRSQYSDLQARYQSLTDDVLDSSMVGIFILDANFSIVWINEALQHYFGLSKEEVMGKDKRQLIHDRIRHIFEDSETFVKKVLATYDNNKHYID